MDGWPPLELPLADLPTSELQLSAATVATRVEAARRLRACLEDADAELAAFEAFCSCLPGRRADSAVADVAGAG